MLLGVWADCRPSEGPRSRSEKPCSPAVRAQRAAIQPPCLLLRFIKKFGPATDAGATNFVRSTQAHSGLQCPELAQLRPQIGSCPGVWCNSDEPIVITGGAGSIKLPSWLAA